MKRRDFIEKTGLLTGGLLLGSSWHTMAATAGPVKMAIIGCGDRGLGILSVLAEQKERFTLTAICDLLDFRLEAARKDPFASSAKVYKDYRQVLDDKNVQGVIIATSLDMHFSIAVDGIPGR